MVPACCSVHETSRLLDKLTQQIKEHDERKEAIRLAKQRAEEWAEQRAEEEAEEERVRVQERAAIRAALDRYNAHFDALIADIKRRTRELDSPPSSP